MLLMAWDHTTHQFTNSKDMVHHPGAESWNGPFASYDDSPRKFISRAVSHVCAPGFFLTMGIGMALFSQARFSAGWTFAQVWGHYLLRGFVLLLAGRLVNFPSYIANFIDVGVHNRTVNEWSGGTFHKGDEADLFRDGWISIFEVMEALAFTMMCSPVFLLFLSKCHAWRTPDLRRLGATELAGLLVFFLFFCMSNMAISFAQGDDPSDASGSFPKSGALADNLWKVIARFALYPGKGPVDYVYIAYPMIPWATCT